MTLALASVIDGLAGRGLALAGVANAAAYDSTAPSYARIRSVAPDCRSVLVVGDSSRNLWDAFLSHMDGCPETLDGPFPLGEHVHETLEAARTELSRAMETDVPLVAFWTASFARLSLVRLAEAAGVGRVLRCGLLVHPEFGPWVTVWGAFLLPVELPASSEPPELDCCGTSALSACPADVFRTGEPEWAVCRSCLDGCSVRAACRYGRSYRYGSSAQQRMMDYLCLKERWTQEEIASAWNDLASI